MNRLLGIVPHILDLDAIIAGPRRQHRPHIVDNGKRTSANVDAEAGGAVDGVCTMHVADDAVDGRDGRRQQQPPQCSNHWKWLNIALCITFAYGYPCAVAKLLKNPTNGNKGVNHFITYIYYGAKYFVTLIIYSVQFSNDKQLRGIRMESLHIYRKLCRHSMVNWRRQQRARPQFPIGFPYDQDGGDGGNRQRPSPPTMNARNAAHFSKTLAMIIGYCIVSYLKLVHVHIFHQPRTMNAIDLACYYYPNVFICLYVAQFSIGIQQQIHIFGKMNNAFQHFIVELNYYGERREGDCGGSGGAGNDDTAACSARRTIQRAGRPSGRNAMRTAVDKLNALIAMHDALRRINSGMECCASWPIVFIIANAFMNIIAEVRSRARNGHIANRFIHSNAYISCRHSSCTAPSS